ncbi:hypothetical protein BGM09_08995 [Streptomyces sp. CBMA29]|nr:hypothetical protein [Streptomyces sp. CBMA29]
MSSTANARLPATTAYSTGNANATTALPTETVTNHYGDQDQLGIVDGTLSQVYLRGASYTLFGELAQAQLGNTGAMVVQTLGYDAITHRLASTLVDRQASGPQTLSNIKYTYDTAGNVTRVRDDQNDGTIADDQCFAYDWARRLSEAWTTADACTTRPVNGTGTPALGSVDPYWTSWTFTNSADRATETQHKAGPITANTTRNYTYPTTTGAARPHAVLNVTATGGATGTDTYQYDEAGNLTTKTPATRAAQGLTWNQQGRLATSAVSGATTAFLYDADGTRILKREPTVTTLYLPGGQELALTKSINTVAGTRYYTIPGGSAIRTSSDARVRLLVADPHGTNTLSVSATTLAFNRRKTMPYGAPRGTAPSFWPGQKGFVNGDIDTTTGYTHIGARDYDPTTGRFISVDPLLDPNDPQSLSGYDYADNTPVTNSDPTGTRLACGGNFEEACPQPSTRPASTSTTPDSDCPPMCTLDGQPHDPNYGQLSTGGTAKPKQPTTATILFLGYPATSDEYEKLKKLGYKGSKAVTVASVAQWIDSGDADQAMERYMAACMLSQGSAYQTCQYGTRRVGHVKSGSPVLPYDVVPAPDPTTLTIASGLTYLSIGVSGFLCPETGIACAVAVGASAAAASDEVISGGHTPWNDPVFIKDTVTGGALGFLTIGVLRLGSARYSTLKATTRAAGPAVGANLEGRYLQLQIQVTQMEYEVTMMLERFGK